MPSKSRLTWSHSTPNELRVGVRNNFSTRVRKSSCRKFHQIGDEKRLVAGYMPSVAKLWAPKSIASPSSVDERPPSS